MLRSELQAEITANIGEILSEKLIEGNADYNYYLATVKETVNKLAEVQQILYFVFDEGGAEEAYYKDKIPESALDYNKSTTAWRDQVQSGIDSRVASDTIEKGAILECDEERELAIVSVYILDASILYNRQYLVYNDNTTTLQFEQIVQE